MSAIPKEQETYVSSLRSLFPNPKLFGLAVRSLDLAAGPPVTIAYFEAAVSPASLESLVLGPLAAGGSVDAFAKLVRSGRLSAPIIETVKELDSLCRGLILGLIAVHVSGMEEALLVGTAAPSQPQASFGPELISNLALLCKVLSQEELKIELGTTYQKNGYAVAYLQEAAPKATVREVWNWAEQLNPQTVGSPWWQVVLGALRLPLAARIPSPATMAIFLRRGYVAVFAQHLTEPLMAPASLTLLLASPGDVDLSPTLRRLAGWSRLLACQVALTVGGLLIAFSSYHHGLIPGAFLMAMAATRQNMPFPTILEMFLMAALGDVANAAALLTGGRRLGHLAWIGYVLAGTVLVQIGVIGSMTITAAVISIAVRDILPSQELRRVVTVWRYLFMAAATGLGIYGLTLLGYAFVVYLSDTDIFGHRLWAEPTSQSS